MGACILDEIGTIGLVDIVLRSTPIYLYPTLPYGLVVYGNILRKSYSLSDVHSQHSNWYYLSAAFRMLRPRYTKLSKILGEKYNIPG